MSENLGKIVRVYTKPNCPKCLSTKRILEKKGIVYLEIDVTRDGQALNYIKNDLGYRSAPVVVVSPEDHWSGFRPDRLKELQEKTTTNQEEDEEDCSKITCNSYCM